MPARNPPDEPAWDESLAAPSGLVGGNRVQLLQGGDELFPRLCEAIGQARTEVWLATYIFDTDVAGRAVADALVAAAQRGVLVRLVVDGFGCLESLPTLREWLRPGAVAVEVFRPLDRWFAWFQPEQLRRLHQKLCVVDRERAFVGGINIIDDRHDQSHGWTQRPRLDFAVEVQGPLALSVHVTTRAIWHRARMGHRWRDEVKAVMHSPAPVRQTVRLFRRLQRKPLPGEPTDPAAEMPVQAAFLVRDNFRQRRSIERAYVEALSSARERIDIAVPYFYPGRAFRRVVRRAARRGVRVRLLLQGKADYRIAALAARAVYNELRGHGVRIFEYTPAFLHAKVAVVDDQWATVGSSNIDPLSLLLNLEANVFVLDSDFARDLGQRLDTAMAASSEVVTALQRPGLRGRIERGLIGWMSALYLRVAGITGRY